MRLSTLGAHPLKDLRDLYADLPTTDDTKLALGKLAIILVLVALAWVIVNILTTAFKDHEEIVERRTVSFIVIRAAMLAGQVVATIPLVSAKSDDTKLDLLWLGLGGLSIIAAFNLLRPVLDKLLYGKLLSANALREASVATAIVQTAFYLAIGLIISGAFTGTAPSTSVAIRATLLFTGLGLVTLLIAYLLAGKFYGMRQAVKSDSNCAAALILGSIVLGLGFMLQAAIAGNFNGWTNGLIGFGLYAVIGIVVLVALVPLLDRLVLPKLSITQLIKEHIWQPAILTATVVVFVAMAMSSIDV
jgi:hypothetical protein